MNTHQAGRVFRIQVFGNVQGVGFRVYVRSVARELGVRGYVKNLDDGSVEIIAVAPRQKVESLINRLRAAGPPIRVTSMTIKEEAKNDVYSDFIILH